tara:strand:+ start:484 stop:1716 length:1233 start_codon:yes stop_codon:yes gene_type:complete
MRIGVPNFDGRRLKQARLVRGLYKNKLAEAVGITPQIVGKYEDGTHKPTHEVLGKLSEVLCLDTAFFTTPTKYDDAGHVFWRKRSAETKAARECTEQRMVWAAEVFEELSDLVEFQTDNPPDLDFPRDYRLTTMSEIEGMALRFRQELGFGKGPIPNMTLLLENIGIPVVFLDVHSDKQDGFQWFAERIGTQFVGVNTRSSTACRVRFDLAHELAHILLHRAVQPNEARSPASHSMLEKQANYFAGALLFPADSFFSEVSYASLDYFLSLKRKWGVSVSGMIERAFALGFITKEERTDLHRKSAQRGWRGLGRLEPMDNDMKTDEPRLMKKGFDLVVSNGILSRTELRAALPIPDSELEAIVGLRDGELASYFKESDNIRVLPIRQSVPTNDLPRDGKVLPFRKSVTEPR